MASPTPSPARPNMGGTGPGRPSPGRPSPIARRQRGRRAAKAPPTAAAAVSTSAASRESGAYRVSGTMTAPVPAHVVWDVLTDFDNQPDVFSSILASRVEPDPANPGALHIIQTCKWKWFLFGGAFEVRLAVSRADPPGRGGGEGALSAAASTSTTPATPANSAPGTLVFTLVSSPFLRSFEGTWTVAPCPLEPESGPAVVGHALAVTPALAPPSAAGGYVGRLFQKQVGGVLADLGEELGRRAAAQVAAAAAAKDGGGVIEV